MTCLSHRRARLLGPWQRHMDFDAWFGLRSLGLMHLEHYIDLLDDSGQIGITTVGVAFVAKSSIPLSSRII